MRLAPRRFATLVRASSASGVVLISGDVHYAELTLWAPQPPPPNSATASRDGDGDGDGDRDGAPPYPFYEVRPTGVDRRRPSFLPHVASTPVCRGTVAAFSLLRGRPPRRTPRHPPTIRGPAPPPSRLAPRHAAATSSPLAPCRAAATPPSPSPLRATTSLSLPSSRVARALAGRGGQLGAHADMADGGA